MPKEEWGVKRVCPTCSTRFYDLQNDPMTCPSCGAIHTVREPFRRQVADHRRRQGRSQMRSKADEGAGDDEEVVLDDDEAEEEDADLADDVLEDDEDEADVSLDELKDVAGEDDED